MSKKTYISRTGIQYTFPILSGGKTVFVSFNGSENTFETYDKEVQKNLEAHDRFINGEIGLSDRTCEDMETAETFTTFAEIKDVHAAISILMAEPYKVAKSKLKTLADIKAQAEINKVVFTNLR